MIFSSTLIENWVNEFSKLPGIGKKSALRLVLHLLKQDKNSIDQFANAMTNMRNQIQFCRQCHNVSDHEICKICTDFSRKKKQVCVVESIRDVMAIEATQQYNGLYHVLGGIISPLDGIGPEQLKITSLIERITQEEIEEMIMALSPTLEGDTTTYYITKKAQHLKVKITTISKGVAFGGELEYADELTLARSILHRLPIVDTISY